MARIVDRDSKRLKIVEAATYVFARKGYEATAMDDVAAAAGVSKGSLYDYFKNKEDLFYAVFEWFERAAMQAAAAQLKPGLTARERLAAFAEASVGAVADLVELYPVTLEVWAAAAKTGSRPRFAQAMQGLYAEYRREVDAMIRAGQDSGEIRREIDAPSVAAVLVGAVDGLLLQYWLDPGFSPVVWVRNFLNALFDGMATEKELC